MTVEWSQEAASTASRFLDDRAWLQAALEAADRLAGDPFPAEMFRWDDVLRLRAGRYRIFYAVDGRAGEDPARGPGRPLTGRHLKPRAPVQIPAELTHKVRALITGTSVPGTA